MCVCRVGAKKASKSGEGVWEGGGIENGWDALGHHVPFYAGNVCDSYFLVQIHYDVEYLFGQT